MWFEYEFYMTIGSIIIGFSILYVFRNIIEPRWQKKRDERPVKYNEKGINISGGVLRGVPGKCDNKCHGTNEEYRYNDIFPLQGIHDLDVRLKKLEEIKQDSSSSKDKEPSKHEKIVIKYSDIQDDLFKRIEDLDINFGEPVAVVDGFLSPQFSTELTNTYILGGSTIPMILLIGDSGRFYFLSFRKLFPELEM